MRRCTDMAVADWLVQSATAAHQLIVMGPEGFGAYARLRYVPDPAAVGQSENDIDLPADHPHDLDQARRALHLLAAHTATPDDCFFAVWDGYSDIHLPPGPLLTGLPYREFALLRGPLRAIDSWEADFGDGFPIAPPGFVWPADQSWCFTSDVDPHFAGIGAGPTAIGVLLGDPVLDVVAADPGAEQPFYY
ncbi:hypothetical protein GCM10009828_101630 [Actinoplanes couchii]|uniref:Uncharacterized protein n=1 Tax=Actinoplanes couchii TaxID=403638 RepID=A0ABQ3XLQ4_9ACTN|nr:hypothetical protein Aco03nite_078270 [Actinoplanes couchii]